jgi:hypothetical protein
VNQQLIDNDRTATLAAAYLAALGAHCEERDEDRRATTRRAHQRLEHEVLADLVERGRMTADDYNNAHIEHGCLEFMQVHVCVFDDPVETWFVIEPTTGRIQRIY